MRVSGAPSGDAAQLGDEPRHLVVPAVERCGAAAMRPLATMSPHCSTAVERPHDGGCALHVDRPLSPATLIRGPPRPPGPRPELPVELYFRLNGDAPACSSVRKYVSNNSEKNVKRHVLLRRVTVLLHVLGQLLVFLSDLAVLLF